MTGMFICLCVIAGLMAVGAVVLIPLSYTKKLKSDFAQEGARAIGVILAILAAWLIIGGVLQFHQCPSCNEWSTKAYCSECGIEFNPTINCPGCENEFLVKRTPVFCPDCGTKVKGGESSES